MTDSAGRPFPGKIFWPLLVALVVAAIVVGSLVGAELILDPQAPWDDQAIAAMPLWLAIWLIGLLAGVFLLSIFFLKRSLAARWALGGFIVGHIPMAMGMALTVGLIGLIHVVCWAPALFFAIRERRIAPIDSFYGVWINAFTAIVTASLFFDALSVVRLVTGL